MVAQEVARDLRVRGSPREVARPLPVIPRAGQPIPVDDAWHDAWHEARVVDRHARRVVLGRAHHAHRHARRAPGGHLLVADQVEEVHMHGGRPQIVRRSFCGDERIAEPTVLFTRGAVCAEQRQGRVLGVGRGLT